LSAYLKVNGHIGYQQLIWPRETADFDLLNIFADDPRLPAQARYPATMVPSDLDLNPTPILLTAQGHYTIVFEAYSENFPRMQFQISLDVTAAVPRVALI